MLTVQQRNAHLMLGIRLCYFSACKRHFYGCILQAAASCVLQYTVRCGLLDGVLSSLSSNMSSEDSAECRESPAIDPDNWKTSES